MATTPERSRPLHNFQLPRLRWGNQRFLRCMKLDGNTNTRSPTESDGSDRSRATTEHRSSPLKPIGCGGGDMDGGIEAVRDKLMFDLKAAADKIKDSIGKEKELVVVEPIASPPWNLRTRRAACKAPGGGGGGGGKGTDLRSEERRNNFNSSTAAATMTSQQSGKRREKDDVREEFSLSLSREEIERDFLVMAGRRPPRRPKKRPKIVQRQVNAIFPGLWLTEITPDRYKVPDIPESGGTDEN